MMPCVSHQAISSQAGEQHTCFFAGSVAVQFATLGRSSQMPITSKLHLFRRCQPWPLAKHDAAQVTCHPTWVARVPGCQVCCCGCSCGVRGPWSP